MPKKLEANLNDYMIFYPSEKGLDKIDNILKEKFSLPFTQRKEWIDSRRTEDGGYKEQIWAVMEDFGPELFGNGSLMVSNTKISIFAE